MKIEHAHEVQMKVKVLRAGIASMSYMAHHFISYNYFREFTTVFIQTCV